MAAPLQAAQLVFSLKNSFSFIKKFSLLPVAGFVVLFVSAGEAD